MYIKLKIEDLTFTDKVKWAVMCCNCILLMAPVRPQHGKIPQCISKSLPQTHGGPRLEDVYCVELWTDLLHLLPFSYYAKAIRLQLLQSMRTEGVDLMSRTDLQHDLCASHVLHGRLYHNAHV